MESLSGKAIPGGRMGKSRVAEWAHLVVLTGLASFLLAASLDTHALAQDRTKISFPYGPLGLNSIPWVVAKDAHIFEKNGLDVDMIYFGASSAIVQSMLSGSANLGGFS